MRRLTLSDGGFVVFMTFCGSSQCHIRPIHPFVNAVEDSYYDFALQTPFQVTEGYVLLQCFSLQPLLHSMPQQ